MRTRSARTAGASASPARSRRNDRAARSLGSRAARPRDSSQRGAPAVSATKWHHAPPRRPGRGQSAAWVQGASTCQPRSRAAARTRTSCAAAGLTPGSTSSSRPPGASMRSQPRTRRSDSSTSGPRRRPPRSGSSSLSRLAATTRSAAPPPRPPAAPRRVCTDQAAPASPARPAKMVRPARRAGSEWSIASYCRARGRRPGRASHRACRKVRGPAPRSWMRAPSGRSRSRPASSRPRR